MGDNTWDLIYTAICIIVLAVGCSLIGVALESTLLGTGVFFAVYGALLMVGTLIERVQINFTATVAIDGEEREAYTIDDVSKAVAIKTEEEIKRHI